MCNRRKMCILSKEQLLSRKLLDPRETKAVCVCLYICVCVCVFKCTSAACMLVAEKRRKVASSLNRKLSYLVSLD